MTQEEIKELQQLHSQIAAAEMALLRFIFKFSTAPFIVKTDTEGVEYPTHREREGKA